MFVKNLVKITSIISQRLILLKKNHVKKILKARYKNTRQRSKLNHQKKYGQKMENAAGVVGVAAHYALERIAMVHNVRESE